MESTMEKIMGRTVGKAVGKPTGTRAGFPFYSIGFPIGFAELALFEVTAESHLMYPGRRAILK